MKTYLTVVAAIVVLAGGAAYTLSAFQRQADEAFSSVSSVRLPDHGVTTNLVGRDWRPSKL